MLLVSDNYEETIAITSKATVKVGDYVTIDQKVSDKEVTPFSGRVVKADSKSVVVRVGRPHLISPGAMLQVDNSALILRGDLLATLVFERQKTGDIVQGLPRVEELLEARKPKDSAIAAEEDGVASIDYEEVWPDGTDESSYEFINEFFYSDVKNTFRRLEPLEASYIGLDYFIDYAFAQLGYFGAGSEDLVSEIKEDGQVVVRTTYDLNDNGSISCIYADFSNDDKTVYEYSYLPTKALLFTPSVRKEPGVDVPYAPKKGRMKHCRGYYR